jgi:hypothetical protein
MAMSVDQPGKQQLSAVTDDVGPGIFGSDCGERARLLDGAVRDHNRAGRDHARCDFLENALFDWAYMPVLPPELTAAICALRHVRSGCTLLHHNGFDDDGVEGARRAHIAIRTYLSAGIRLAFSPGVRDESKLAMGGEEFIETLPPDLRVGASEVRNSAAFATSHAVPIRTTRVIWVGFSDPIHQVEMRPATNPEPCRHIDLRPSDIARLEAE